MPLHRRGNSQTYERLEDLLKEAGYKETRVFTPETERSDSGDSRNQDNRLRGMDAVVGFFAGLLPSAMSSKISLELPESGSSGPTTTSPQEDYSPPVSPLTHRAVQRQGKGGEYDLTEPPSPTTLISSIESLGESTPRLNRLHDPRINNATSTVNPHVPRTYHTQRPPLPHRTSSQLSYTSEQMQKQSSRTSLHHQAIQHHSNIVSPRPSRRGTYVRHMASASSMPPRPNSTPAHMSRPAIFVDDIGTSSTHTPHVKPDGDDPDQPPLPPSWLKSVARAVLFGGAGTYIGGPSMHESSTNPSCPRPAKAQVLRASRSSLSQVSSRRSKHHRQSTNRRSGLSDQTNTQTMSSRSAFLAPPPLFSQIERGRSGRSEGEVSKTRVMCRSAPGSRNGSVTRSSTDDGKERWRKRDTNSKKKEGKGRLPSLARTQAEGDVWDPRTSEAHTRGDNNDPIRYLSGWGANADSEAGPHSSSEEEEDGELNLARILVPPKRQNSIKSLRKHLSPEAGLSAHASLKNYAARGGSMGRSAGRGINVTGINGGDGTGQKPSRVPTILQRRRTEEDWDGESQEEWGAGWVRKGAGNRESEDDDVDSFIGFFGEGRKSLMGAKSGTGRNRLSAWGLIGGNGS